MAIDSDVSMDEVLGRLDALLNKDKSQSDPEVSIPLLTEVYIPASETQPNQMFEEVLPPLVNELEEMMKQAIVELRPKTEALLRQHLEQVLARAKSPS
ncbi:MAG: hypothetical protein K8Q92_02195 [Methylophilales bacterium]|nr:hypothetical protein [Methylophilales bacterium]